MSGNESPAVELRGVSFSYGKRPILEDVNLSLRTGEVTAILGPNGCGKSTTVKLINRQLVPCAGQVVIEGRDVADMGRKEVARHVAVLGQAVGVASMRAEQFVMCGRYPHRAALASPTARDHEIVHDAMCRAGCLQHAGADMARLSGGERQRVLLAAVLAQGRVQAFGSVEDVAASGIIDRVFDVRLQRMSSDADGRAGYCLMPRR